MINNKKVLLTRGYGMGLFIGTIFLWGDGEHLPLFSLSRLSATHV